MKTVLVICVVVLVSCCAQKNAQPPEEVEKSAVIDVPILQEWGSRVSWLHQLIAVCEILLKKKENYSMVRDEEQSVFPKGEEITTTRPHLFTFYYREIT